MASKSPKKLWESEFEKNVSKKDKIRNINIIQLKLKENDAYRKMKKTTNFEPTDDTDDLNKAYLDEKLSKIECQISCFQKDYNEFELHYNKQSVEEILIQRAVIRTRKILYDKSFFDNHANSDENFLFTKQKPDLEESK